MDLLSKVGKVAVGIAGALVVGELTAIGFNAAIDDLKAAADHVKGVIQPEVIKPKGFFRKK